MHILFVGYGKTSQAVAKQLLRLGHNVSTISRSPKPPDGALHLVQDVHQLELKAIAAIDMVYVLLSPGHADPSAYQHTFVDSVQPIVTALASHPVQRVIVVSSTRVYGQQQGELIDDDTVPMPSDLQGEALLEMERLWRQAYPEKAIIIRPSGIYGHSVARMIKLAQNTHEYPKIHWSNRIHHQDLVDFLVMMLHVEHPEPAYIVSDNTPIALHQIVMWFQQQLDIPVLAVGNEQDSGKRIYATRMTQTGFELQHPDCFKVYQSLLA